jgi:hypothetical protein
LKDSNDSFEEVDRRKRNYFIEHPVMLAGRVNGAVDQRKEIDDLGTQNIPFTRMMRMAMRAEGDGA